MGEEKRQSSDRPQRGRGRPAGCREAFQGGARGCLTLPSEAHRRSFVGQAAACRNVCGRGPWVKRRGRLRTGHREAGAGLPAAEKRLRGGRGLQKRLRAGPVGEEKRQASDRPQRGRGRPAGCREAFEGGARGCLTLPSEAHRKSFVGQAPACRNVCGRGPWVKRRGRLRTERPGQACRLPRSV